MTTGASESRVHSATWQARLARHVVDTLGGRYSAELGIDVDAGDAEIERWFLAATLFGTRITAEIAARTFRVLTGAGLVRVGQARHIPHRMFIGYLDQGGYARYDEQTVARLRALSEIIGERYDGQAAVIGRRHQSYPGLRAALGVLPGWGPVTIQLFLRELRGVWPGAQPPLDPRAEYAARHLGLLSPARPGRTSSAAPGLGALNRLATDAGTDPRDLESGLVRLTLAHHHHRWLSRCPGGGLCAVLWQRPGPGQALAGQSPLTRDVRPLAAGPGIGDTESGLRDERRSWKRRPRRGGTTARSG